MRLRQRLSARILCIDVICKGICENRARMSVREKQNKEAQTAERATGSKKQREKKRPAQPALFLSIFGPMVVLTFA